MEIESPAASAMTERKKETIQMQMKLANILRQRAKEEETLAIMGSRV